LKYGQIDGAHHKLWVLDQAVRILTGCPVEVKTAKSHAGTEYTYKELVPGKLYKKLIRKSRKGEDGPKTYGYDEGIAP
jgi:hypothetical protein